MNILRDVLCWMVIVFMPGALVAADSGVGMVRAYGTAWLNGTAVEQSSAIFPGDLVQTNSNSAVKITSPGSSVTVLPESLVKFEGGAVSVEHGSVKLVTSKGMFARAGAVTVAPASSGWTQFELTDVGGTVQISALKGDLQLSDGSRTATLSQGQRTTQEDSDKTPSKLVRSSATSLVKIENEEEAGSFAPGGGLCFCGQPYCFGPHERCRRPTSPTRP